MDSTFGCLRFERPGLGAYKVIDKSRFSTNGPPVSTPSSPALLIQPILQLNAAKHTGASTVTPVTQCRYWEVVNVLSLCFYWGNNGWGLSLHLPSWLREEELLAVASSQRTQVLLTFFGNAFCKITHFAKKHMSMWSLLFFKFENEGVASTKTSL